MRLRREIYGKTIRNEVKSLLEQLNTNENEIDALSLRSHGVACLGEGKETFVSFRLKQSEIEYLISGFPQGSKNKWNYIEFIAEGDDEHFGKTYRFTKCAKEDGT